MLFASTLWGSKIEYESNSWIKLHYNQDAFGFVVDAHVLFEHLHGVIIKESDESLTKNVILSKNSLHTAYEALILSSYDRKAPKLFKKNKGLNVIDMKDSYFDVIPTYKKWKAYETGFRYIITSELKEIRTMYE